VKSVNREARVVCFGMVLLLAILFFAGSRLLLGQEEAGEVMAARIFLASSDNNLFDRNEELAKKIYELSSEKFLEFLHQKWPLYSSGGFGTAVLDPSRRKSPAIFLTETGVTLTSKWLDRDRKTMEVRLLFSRQKDGNTKDMQTSFSSNLDRCFLFRLKLERARNLIVAFYPASGVQAKYSDHLDRDRAVPQWISAVVKRHDIYTRRTQHYNKNPEFMAFCESSSVGGNQMTIVDPVMLLNEGDTYMIIEASSVLLDGNRLLADVGKAERFSFAETGRGCLASWKGEKIEILIRSSRPSEVRTMR